MKNKELDSCEKKLNQKLNQILNELELLRRLPPTKEELDFIYQWVKSDFKDRSIIVAFILTFLLQAERDGGNLRKSSIQLATELVDLVLSSADHIRHYDDPRARNMLQQFDYELFQLNSSKNVE